MPPALVIASMSRLELAESYGPLRRVRVLRQDNSLSFYEPVSEEARPEDGLE
jgi:hypothetical protein